MASSLKLQTWITHPPMKKPDGKIWRSFSFVKNALVKNGRVEAQTVP
jgi:hypothetical protein